MQSHSEDAVQPSQPHVKTSSSSRARSLGSKVSMWLASRVQRKGPVDTRLWTGFYNTNIAVSSLEGVVRERTCLDENQTTCPLSQLWSYLGQTAMPRNLVSVPGSIQKFLCSHSSRPTTQLLYMRPSLGAPKNLGLFVGNSMQES